MFTKYKHIGTATAKGYKKVIDWEAVVGAVFFVIVLLAIFS